jgi:hypothetical protein
VGLFFLEPYWLYYEKVGVDDLAGFVKFVLPDRVDKVVNSPPYLKFANPRYGERFLMEIDKVESGGFWSNLIFAAETVRLARLEPAIPYVCRGSAGSSLMCYLVGITNVDPVLYNISLERFLGAGRDKPPDIDLDFPSEARPLIWERLRGRFGNRLGFVATKLRYRKRGALREALRRCGIPFEFWIGQSPVISETQRQRVCELSASLEGKVYGLSKHCGGIVFFPKGIPYKFFSSRPKQPFSQLVLDKDELDGVGFGKLDVLSNYALSHLTYIGKTDLLDSLELGQEDKNIGRLFSSGNSWGILHAESPAMRKLFIALGTASMESVILALGLVRPAVSSMGAKPVAVGRNPLERMLVYEDDVAEFLSVILGGDLSLGEFARRVLAKGGVEAKKLLEDIGRVVKRKGKDRILFRGRHWTWAQIKRQLGLATAYSFCKSHATAYGRLVWALGSVKVEDPRLFWEGFLSTAITSSMYRPWVYFERIKYELGVSVVWPGDLSVPLGRYLKVPWAINHRWAYPSLSGRVSLRSRGMENLFQQSFPSFGLSSYDSQTLSNQLTVAGFWAGGCKDRGPMSKTYLCECPNGLGSNVEETGYFLKPNPQSPHHLSYYEFRGLRALKFLRVHPLNSETVCLFQTLGVGRGKILEVSSVFGKQSQKLSMELSSNAPYFSSRGLGFNAFETYYLKV